MSNRVFTTLGGRKSAAGFFAAVLLTIMAFPLSAEFTQYMTGILIALGLTQGTVAWEDTRGSGRGEVR